MVKVVIHVLGGIAHVVEKTKGVEVVIKDYDEEAEEEELTNTFKTDEVIKMENYVP